MHLSEALGKRGKVLKWGMRQRQKDKDQKDGAMTNDQ